MLNPDMEKFMQEMKPRMYKLLEDLALECEVDFERIHVRVTVQPKLEPQWIELTMVPHEST